MIRQLDLVTSLSLALLLGSRSCRTQLENKPVQQLTQKSFQLTKVQLCQCLAQGGVQHKAFHNIALRTRSWRRSATRRSWSTRSSHTASTTTTTKRTTRSLQRTLLSIVWFSFLLSNIFLSNSFWKQEVAENNELQETVWAQELDKHLAIKHFQEEQLQQQLQENIQEKNYQSEKLELQEHNAELSFNLACSPQFHHNNQNNPALTTELWENELGMNLAELAAWIIQLFNHNHDNTNIELAETQLENIKKKKKKKQNNTASQQLGQQQLPLQQPDAAVQLQQLCLQDPASAANRQLPKESLSSTCLSDSSLDPAASLTDTLSFSKQKLSAQDLPDQKL